MNWSVLQESYPFNSGWKKDVLSALLFGSFIFLFLLIFQPFGLSNYSSTTKTWELAGYGLVTSGTLLLNNNFFSLLFPKWYSKPCWTVGKNITYTTYIFFCIGLGNFLYSVWLNFLPFDLKGFLFYQGLTIMVGIFPVTISTLLIYNKRLKQAAKEAEQLNSALGERATGSYNLIEIPSQNKSENLQIDLGALLSIRAVENYIEVNIEENGVLKKQVIRNTLKNIEEHLTHYPFIKKCHRSYLVNLNKVDNFSGNAQGLNLHFHQFRDFEIPVSRAYVKDIKAEISK